MRLTPLISKAQIVKPMETEPVFQSLVDQFYQPLYRFALSLSQSPADACDLVQQAFYLWAVKGHHLRDPTKAKMWLFTTLYREFLNRQRRMVNFPHREISEAENELPAIEPPTPAKLDCDRVLAALADLDETFRAPVALYFLEEYSYQEIATALAIPIGTVKSRLSRGLRHLHHRLHHPTAAATDVQPPAAFNSSS